MMYKKIVTTLMSSAMILSAFPALASEISTSTSTSSSMKIRQFEARGELVALSSKTIPAIADIKLSHRARFASSTYESGAIISVQLNSDTKITDQQRKQISLALVSVGDRVRVHGVRGENGVMNVRLFSDTNISHIRKTGVISSVSADAIGVTVRDVLFTMSISSDVNYLSKGKTAVLSDFQIGNEVAFAGEVNTKTHSGILSKLATIRNGLLVDVRKREEKREDNNERREEKRKDGRKDEQKEERKDERKDEQKEERREERKGERKDLINLKATGTVAL